MGNILTTNSKIFAIKMFVYSKTRTNNEKNNNKQTYSTLMR